MDKCFKIFCLIPLFALGGCNMVKKLSTVGEPPALSQIKNPKDLPGYEPVTMPMPEPQAFEQRTNSLWQTGSRAFFKDQRAAKIGDVLTVEVSLDRKQSIQMSPDIEPQSSLSTTVTSVLGHQLPIQKRIAKALPGKEPSSPALMTEWANTNSAPVHKATATYDVQDKMRFKMAAVVIEILPNGNMVIQGREEIRLVNELREVELKGVIRREDVTSNNTISGEKIANLRISYGGRGDLTDAQSAPWGQQYMQKILPF